MHIYAYICNLLIDFAQKCNELYLTNPEGNIPQNNNGNAPEIHLENHQNDTNLQHLLII